MADYEAIAQKLMQTWPARMAQDAWSAVKAPGNAYASTPDNPVTTEQMIKPAADLSSMLTLGAGSIPASANELRMGIRPLPSDNYLKPLSEHTKQVWRETSPQEALAIIPHSNVSGGAGPGGSQRLFYADTPDLALGQGQNKGVRLGYDAGSLQGQINKKPGWDYAYQQGNAEYQAMPVAGKNLRDSVNYLSVDKNIMANESKSVQSQYQRVIDRLLENGWTKSEAGHLMELSAPK